MREVILTATFDIDQDSQLLRWSFLADGKPISGDGVETGLLAFQVNDSLNVRVVANSKNRTLRQVDINSCHIITTPLAFTKREDPDRAGEFPDPSPFGDEYAVIDLGYGTCENDAELAKGIWNAKLPLQCDNTGRWELSFIITVTIAYSSGHVERRVFEFDPECEVGAGA
jgi:hypothetical protein